MERMARLSCELQELKAVESNGERIFEGYGAVFGNKDHHGDVIEPGAITSP